MPLYLKIGPNWPNWQCCLAGNTKTAPRILIFSIAVGADYSFYMKTHRLRTPGEEIAFTEQPKIHSHSQIFSYGRSIFCLPHRPKFPDFFDLCLHWVSVVREENHAFLYVDVFMWPKMWICITEFVNFYDQFLYLDIYHFLK